MNREIKIAFFDIDGTILPFGKKDLSDAVKDALHQLQNNGIRIFVATGRPAYYVQDFPGIQWDGMLCFNGAYCIDQDGIIFSSPIPHEDVMKVSDNFKRLNTPYAIATGSECITSSYDETLEEYFRFSKHTCIIPEKEIFEKKMQEDVYEMMAALPVEKEKEVLEGTKSCAITRWWDKAFDLGPLSATKALGMKHILDHYHLKREQSISFGDGGNDVSMLEYAGIGVAMGNALNDVKKRADYVAEPCEKDGVVSALKHFNLI